MSSRRGFYWVSVLQPQASSSLTPKFGVASAAGRVLAEGKTVPIDLDISSLQKAIGSLEAALVRHDQTPTDDLVRDGCIQRFEFVYELSHKLLKRFRKATSPNPAEIDALAFPTLSARGRSGGCS